MKTKFAIFFLVFTMMFACDNGYSNYQDLEDGLYAEFDTNMGTMLEIMPSQVLEYLMYAAILNPFI